MKRTLSSLVVGVMLASVVLPSFAQRQTTPKPPSCATNPLLCR